MSREILVLIMKSNNSILSGDDTNPKEYAMMSASRNKHTKLWLILGLGLVLIPAWLLFLFLAVNAILREAHLL
jgi:hypothetical protein